MNEQSVGVWFGVGALVVLAAILFPQALRALRAYVFKKDGGWPRHFAITRKPCRWYLRFDFPEAKGVLCEKCKGTVEEWPTKLRLSDVVLSMEQRGYREIREGEAGKE